MKPQITNKISLEGKWFLKEEQLHYPKWRKNKN